MSSIDWQRYLKDNPDVQTVYGASDEGAASHYKDHGQKEGRKVTYKGALADTGTDAATDFDINRFDQLLNRLEASKGRQQRQKSVEGRRDIFSQGLAGMMSNF